MKPLRSRSVAGQLTLIGVAILLLFPIVAISSLWNLSTQSRDIQGLTLVFGPAFDANNTALLDMTEANAGWDQTVGGGHPLTRYRLKQGVVEDDLAEVERAVSSSLLSRSDRARYSALLADQRTAVARWFDSAEAAEDGMTGSLAARGVLEADALDRFRLFRDANRAFNDAIRAQRDDASTGSRSSFAIVVGIVAVTALLAMGTVLGGWRMLQGSVSGPLGRLRSVVARQRDGDRDALADVDHGADELRALAADFNGLTRSNTVLREQQTAVLEAHQLALDVARVVHGVPDIDSAVHSVCAMLGEGLSAARVLLYTFDEAGDIDQRTQWHRHDLPDLPPLPPSLAREVQVVSEELRRQATVFVVSDFLDPVIQAQDRAERFYRATGSQSLLMVPVGVGDQGLGVLSIMTVDGPRRWRRYEIQAVQQCAGYVAQSIVALRLRQMKDLQVIQLTELDKQKTDFLATVSHELRTPLTSINGYLELLEDGDYGDLSGEQRSALSIIERNATRLRGLIEDLLVLNKIEATGLQSSLEDVNVADLVHGVLDLLRPVADAGHVELVAEPIDPGLVVRVDRNQLERTLINLGSNAVKFTPAGGHASLGATGVEDRVVIDVTDTGIGIPERDQEQLFDRFFRASNATEAAIPGTGLGLAIVRAIVEGHHGQLLVDSVEGEGTTVQIVLPMAEVRPALVGNAGPAETV